MKEEFLHYLWKTVLYNSVDLQTTEGIPLQILKHGEKNCDAGPDFFNAKVKIGETLWAGNVEIHVRSSDWIRHGHHENKLYDSVVLHVVYQNDTAVKRTNGTIIPTLVLPVDASITNTYNSFWTNKNHIVVCKDSLSAIDSFQINMWLERMLIERLEQKTERVSEYLQETTTDWEDTFYRLLARSFGFNVNAQAFEQLSRMLPQQVLAKHKSSVFQLEALLFGVAGMLDTDCEDDYFLSLKKEFLFLQAKYSLTTLPYSSWKFMRMRPANFPTIRIAQMAQLIHHSSALFSKIIECEKVESLLSFFYVEVSTYWLTHFSFAKSSNYSSKHLGEKAIQSILINAIIPVLFLYGKIQANEIISDKALQFLEQLPFENNEITRNWTDTPIECKNAARSQALIHLYKTYCVAGNCLQCVIGDRLMRQSLMK